MTALLAHGQRISPTPLPGCLPRLRGAGRIPQRAVDARGLQLLPQHRRAHGRHARAHRQDGRAVRRPQPAATAGERTLAGQGLHAGRPAAVPGLRAAPGPSGSQCSTMARSGVLGEDNGAYVFSLPGCDRARAAAGAAVARRRDHGDRRQALRRSRPTSRSRWSRPRASCPNCRRWGRPFRWWNCAAPMAKCSASTTARSRRQLTRGRSVRLEDLQLTGLREESAKEERARQFNCPNCGAPVEVALASSKSDHLPLVPQPDRPDARASAASCATRSRTSRSNR